MRLWYRAHTHTHTHSEKNVNIATYLKSFDRFSCLQQLIVTHCCLYGHYTQRNSTYLIVIMDKSVFSRAISLFCHRANNEMNLVMVRKRFHKFHRFCTSHTQYTQYWFWLFVCINSLFRTALIEQKIFSPRCLSCNFWTIPIYGDTRKLMQIFPHFSAFQPSLMPICAI